MTDLPDQEALSGGDPAWTEVELNWHIDARIEESLRLDYKSAGALDRRDEKKKLEVSKDVSAMANSEGGIIIYGISERNHLPRRITWLDRTQITREWLEEIIATGISPRISDLQIHCVTHSANPKEGAYVVEVPRSHTAHQAKDWRYYRRRNFQSVPMGDEEIRVVMNRGIVEIIETKISDGFGLLYGFFVMLAHSADLGDTAVSVVGSEHKQAFSRGVIDEVAESYARAVRDRGIFDPEGGTLRDLPRERGIIHTFVEAGDAPEPKSLPASYILLEGVRRAAAACGTTLATYGPSMGLELVVRVDRLHGHLYSAQQVFSAICGNAERLKTSGGRITDEVFLDHIRLMVRYLAEFHRHRPNET